MSTTLQAAADRLPRGPHTLSRAEVEHHQRDRILAAIIAAVAEKSYGSTTIGDITLRARVARNTFYQQFRNKEDCFLAAYDTVAHELLAEMVAVGTSQPSYVEGMRDGVRAYLRFWSERPEAAQALTIEGMAAGQAALARRDRTLQSFARLFRTVAERARVEEPGLPAVPDIVSHACVAAAFELTTRYVREGRVSSLPELEDDILYVWLMGLAGHEIAAAALAS